MKEPLVIFDTHTIKAAAAPTLEPDGSIVYEPGPNTYIITTAHKGAYIGLLRGSEALTWLGDLETKEYDLDVWLEAAWYLDVTP